MKATQEYVVSNPVFKPTRERKHKMKVEDGKLYELWHIHCGYTVKEDWVLVDLAGVEILEGVG